MTSSRICRPQAGEQHPRPAQPDPAELAELPAGQRHDQDREDDRDHVDQHASTVARAVSDGSGPCASIRRHGRSPEVLYAVERGVARVTINRPERRNAMSYGVMQGLRDAVAAAKADDDGARRRAHRRR